MPVCMTDYKGNAMFDDISYSILGVKVNALTYGQVLARIASSIDAGERVIMGNHNLHSIFLFATNATMQEFCRKSRWIYIDGMPIVFIGRLLGHPLRREHRVTFIDWQPLFAEAHRRGWRVFYLGSKAGVAQNGAEILRQKFPSLEIDFCHGYFDETTGSTDNEEVISKINRFRPQLLLVGMGMPRQEAWILDNMERLNANVICNCGATMDFLAGAIATPPRWMGKIGLDWMYRLMCEPRRLGSRYLIEPLFICYLLIKQLYAGQHANEKQD
jgi:N-acetylglucosaminyldiphosphoundecaprenol N-acetyl-beta-D-mannosaminyltransferase